MYFFTAYIWNYGIFFEEMMNLNSLEVRPNIFGSIVPSRMYITKNAQHFKVRDLTINDVQAN